MTTKNSWHDGLGKQCSKHPNWDRCPCPWWGKYKGVRRSLAKWARCRIANKTQAWEALTRFKAEIDRYGKTGQHEGDIAEERGEAITVAECVKRYRKDHCEARGLSDKALSSALSRIEARFGVRPLLDLEAAAPIEEWIAAMAAEGLSKRSQKAYAARLAAMLRWAKARGYIKQTGFDSKSIRFGKDAQRGRTLKAGEEAALIAASQRMNNKRHKFVGPLMEGRLYCALDTAIRQGTMLNLQNKHIDFNDWVIHIPADIAKDDEDLDIPVESKRLRTFLTKRRILGPEAYPFGHHDGSYQGDIKKAMHTLFKLAGITFGRGDMVWHDLRHDATTMLVAELNTPLSVAKEITGHAHASMLERYVNPKPEQKRQALRRLAEAREAKLQDEANQEKRPDAKAS